MKRIYTFIFAVVMAGGIVACSDDKAASTGGSGGEQSTALSIDTGEGSFSYKNDAGGDSTSVSVDADDSEKGQ